MPVLRLNCGVPVTVTAALKVTWMGMTVPIPYVPSGVEDVTLPIVVQADVVKFRSPPVPVPPAFVAKA